METIKQVKRIRSKEGESAAVQLQFQQPSKKGIMNKFTFICHDPARPQFDESMGKLAGHVNEILELPAGYIKPHEITGVSFSHTAEGIMGAVITVHHKTGQANAPVIFNTPHLPESPYNTNNEEEKVLSPDCVLVLQEIAAEARIYLNGERANQLTLFGGENGISTANGSEAADAGGSGRLEEQLEKAA